jgi:hypothetical protein
MAKLLDDNPPIDAGPIIVDSWRLDRDLYPGEYIDYSVFVVEALSHGIQQGKATKAIRLAVASMITTLDLGILPPYEEAEGEQTWGPYGAHDYYIDAHAYAGNADAIEEFAVANTVDDESMQVLRFVREEAEQLVRYDTDKIRFSKLPRAFYTPIFPDKHMKSGRLLSVTDFRDAARGAVTSSAKTASVFDALIKHLGDNEAQQRIAELIYQGNPYTRSGIRESLYLKIQAVADFVANFDDLPQEVQADFNTLSLKVLRNILFDEER